MKTIRFGLIVAALAVLLGGAIANSQTADATAPVHGHAFGMRSPMMGFFAKYLDLTDAQRTQMKAVLQKEHAAMKPQMQQLHLMQQQLKQYEEGTYDEAKVQALVAQQSQTLVQLKVQERGFITSCFSCSLLTSRPRCNSSRPIGRRECSNVCRNRPQLRRSKASGCARQNPASGPHQPRGNRDDLHGSEPRHCFPRLLLPRARELRRR